MGEWRQTLAEATRLFFLSIGISNAGGRKYKPELAKISSGEGWASENCEATIVDYEGKWALRLAAKPGEGAVWLLDHECPGGKIDLKIAAINQRAGLLLRPIDSDTSDLIGFSFDLGTESPDGEFTLLLWCESGTFDERQDARLPLPSKLRGEWIPLRIVVTGELVSVHANNGHVALLKVNRSATSSRRLRLGIWRGADTEALLADWKLIETEEWNLK